MLLLSSPSFKSKCLTNNKTQHHTHTTSSFSFFSSFSSIIVILSIIISSYSSFSRAFSVSSFYLSSSRFGIRSSKKIGHHHQQQQQTRSSSLDYLVHCSSSRRRSSSSRSSSSRSTTGSTLPILRISTSSTSTSHQKDYLYQNYKRTGVVLKLSPSSSSSLSSTTMNNSESNSISSSSPAAATTTTNTTTTNATTTTAASASSPRKIIVVGSSNQDLTSYTNSIPKLGQTVLGQRFEVSPGGKGANQAIAAAKICKHSKEKEKELHEHQQDQNVVHIITRVGNDPFAHQLQDNFDQCNVHYDPSTIKITSPDTYTGVAPIIVDQKTGDNMIVVIPGANNQLTPDMVRKEMNTIKQNNTFNNIRHDMKKVVILSQLEIPLESTLEAMKIGKEWGALTILNPAPCNCQIFNNQLLQYVDIIIPNETELQQLVGAEKMEMDNDNDDNDNNHEEEMAKKLFERGIHKAVIVTLGARGAMIVTKNSTTQYEYDIRYVNAHPELECNDQPVLDTVGAGDCFCGSLSVYLSAGLELFDAATKACSVASMSVRKSGAQTSYPSYLDLPPMLQVHDDDESKDGSVIICNQSSQKVIPKTLTFVTGNKKKLEEVQQILCGKNNGLPFEIKNEKIDLPELQGDPIDIAIEKCKLAAQEVNGPVFTEDTSLCFNALNGLPGPYIKWFLDKCGHDGLNRMLNGFDDTSAYAQTVVAFTWGPGQNVHVFDGRTNGSIVQPRGPLDFGWDPIFQPDEGNGMTYAEMDKDAKNRISHRGKSFVKFQSYLESLSVGGDEA